MTMDLSNFSPAVLFFYKNAGYSYNPVTETPEEGMLRCARALAEAEDWAQASGVDFDEVESELPWDGDDPLPEGCILSDFMARVWGPPCPHCGERKRHVASLSVCAYTPGDGYPRVVRAELAVELRGLVK